MSKIDMIYLFMAIENLRDQLKRCKDKNEMREVHERLITLYACIDTNAVIDNLADKVHSNYKKSA